ncbi:MAG: Gfo/Idh/MocA family oxidoreductase [Eubacteriales bacterium]|nr:Gfo/Idh/MocA family oxidoreductase [Eubacteriales bacterium]
MNQPITVAICGCGCRGLEAYAPYQKMNPDRMKIVAGADIRPERLELLRSRYGVSPEYCFDSDEALLNQPRLADVMIIATQDRQHVGEALRALEKGYHLLLEKPISPKLSECIALQQKAHEMKRQVIVCHVLRYTPFYSALKQLLERGDIGRVETIDAVEHIAYWHYAHSYVRGNWRRLEESSPLILAKNCHDMDMLRWLAGTECQRLSSFGSLDWFKAENAPEGAADRCLDGCLCKEKCPYDAERIYITNPRTGVRYIGGNWPCSVLTNQVSEENIYNALKTGPYGRCVYHCDNDVADHQTVNMEFAGGITATFTTTAFTDACHRTIKITGTMGEVEGDLEENKLSLRRFGETEQIIDLGTITSEFAGHGGGDMGLMDALCGLIATQSEGGLTSVDASVESHVMALAAEYSRTHGGKVIELDAFAKQA